MNREIREVLEKGIGSKGKLRILITLAENPGLSKYMLERITGIRSKTLNSNLYTLIELNWVREETNHVKRYYLNLENDIAALLLKFFRDSNVI